MLKKAEPKKVVKKAEPKKEAKKDAKKDVKKHSLADAKLNIFKALQKKKADETKKGGGEKKVKPEPITMTEVL